MNIQEKRMNEVSSEELEGVAATVGAIQRIAMAIVELPQEERRGHYTVVRKSLAAAIKELGVDDPIANAWLDKTIVGIQALVMEIEAGGGHDNQPDRRIFSGRRRDEFRLTKVR